MYSTLLLIFVAVAALVALQNWRLGLLLCIVVGVLQDPIRKVTPDTPIYLTLAFIPIYVAMIVNLGSTQAVLPNFFRYYAHSTTMAQIFLLTIALCSLTTLSYGRDAWQAVIVGLTFYIGWIPALFLGFFFLRRSYAELDRPLMLVAALTSLMLVGTPLEYLGYKFALPWLGMVNYTGEWRRWYTETDWVAMISGFYRSPEIMGWHAMVLVSICGYLLIRRPALAALWLPQIAWGLFCVLLSGRRKMFILILVFAALFIVLSEGRRRSHVVFSFVLAGVILLAGAVYFVDHRYLGAAESGLTSANSRVSGHTFEGPLWLLSVVGAFGYGIGTRSQGVQHLAVTFEVPAIEGGFEKILVELGIVGTLVVIVFVVFLVRMAISSFKRTWVARMDSTPIAALAAFLIANGLAYLVAFQVYGDPLIGFVLGFTGGLLLSASRLVAQQEQEQWLTAAGQRANVPKPPAARTEVKPTAS